MRLFLTTLLTLIIGFAHAEKIQKREVEPFSEITLKIEAQLHFIQDDVQSIEIRVGKASTMQKIITEVKDRQLIVRFTNNDRWFKDWEPGKIDIYITAPDIEALNVAGSGSIKVEDELNSRIIDLNLNGSGDITVDYLETEKMNVNIQGSGSIKVKNCSEVSGFKALISGSGDFFGMAVPTKKAKIKISGSGVCEITCNGKIDATIIGSGQVLYKGNPDIDTKIVGRGKVMVKK
ncbi:DUF2807 domain-containing protein [Halosquirtibacter laminarini]|uniref:DUF2807 domain-containing protein n=1 Tax=Halosquirtibacter laminarini TaxID=3374600 RepID=A0AC61NFF0_9BACT|nr:DUF2807 domain-containing protein [Prolixibacteraceae bacterium]